MRRTKVVTRIVKRCLAVGVAISLTVGNGGTWLQRYPSVVMAAGEERAQLPPIQKVEDTAGNLIFNGHMNYDTAGWIFTGDESVKPKAPEGQTQILNRADFTFSEASTIAPSMKQEDGRKVALSFGCTYELKFDVTSTVARTVYAKNLCDAPVFVNEGQEEQSDMGAPQNVKPYTEEENQKTTITYQLVPGDCTQMFQLQICLEDGFEEGEFQPHDIGISNIRLLKTEGDGGDAVPEVEGNKLENGNFSSDELIGWQIEGKQPVTKKNRLDFNMDENDTAKLSQSDIILYTNCTYELSLDGLSTEERQIYAKVVSENGGEISIETGAESEGIGEPQILTNEKQTVTYTIRTGAAEEGKQYIKVNAAFYLEAAGKKHTVGLSNAVLRMTKGEEPFVISKGCAAYASSEAGDDATAMKAFDGDMTSRWQAKKDDSKEWLYVDLGAPANISMIEINWEAASARQYTIDVSDDEETWNTVYKSPVNTKGVRKDVIDLTEADNASNCRYVRISCLARNTTYGCSVYEMKLYGEGGLAVRPETKGNNIAKGKQVIASGIDESGWNLTDGVIKPDAMENMKPENVVDGRDSSNWYVNQPTKQWIMVDLGKKYNIGKIALNWGKDSARFYDIQIYQGDGQPEFEHYYRSENKQDQENDAYYNYRWRYVGDDSDWKPVYRNLEGYIGTENIPIYLEGIQYIRVYGYAANNQEGFRLNELEVYEYQDGEGKVEPGELQALPELKAIHIKDSETGKEKEAAYVEDDMYIPQAKRPLFRTDDYGLDQEGNRTPIASNDWWQSLLINRFGNKMVTLPYKAGYSQQGLGILTASAGWLNESANVYADTTTHPENEVDFYVQPDGLIPSKMEDRVAANSDYSVVTQLWDKKKVGMTATFVKGSPYIFMDFTNTEKGADENDGKLVTIYSTVIHSITDETNSSVLDETTGWVTTDHFYLTVKDTDCKQIDDENPNYAYNTYCLNLPPDSQIKKFGNKIKIQFSGDDRYLSVGTLPVDKINDVTTRKKLHEHGYAFPMETKVTYDFDTEGSNDITTQYTISTKLMREGFSKETIQGILPHQWKKLTDQNGKTIVKADIDARSLGTFTTARGNMKLLAGNTFYTKDKFLGIMPTMTLPQNTKKEEESDRQVYDSAVLKKYLNTLYDYYREAYENKTLPGADAYWQGKSVHPIATGVLVADMIGDGELKEAFMKMLYQIYDDWFTYDTNKTDKNGKHIEDDIFLFHDKEWGTIYYGASEFLANTGITDHHFTYGYMVYGAVVMAAYDQHFYNQYKEIVEMMVRDYASPYYDDDMFCRFRNFDPYEGHSWAGGYADNDDGNNQEAAGESLFGWVSEYLWGTLTENNELRDAGAYGFTTEMNAIKNYWFNYYRDAEADEGGNWLLDWDYQIIGQAYAANNYYGTFFNGNPICVYGIHWLPLSEFLTYYGIEQDAVEQMYNGLERDTNLWREQWIKESVCGKGNKSADTCLEEKLDQSDIIAVADQTDIDSAHENGYDGNFGGYVKDVLKMTFSQYVAEKKRQEYQAELIADTYRKETDDNWYTISYKEYKEQSDLTDDAAVYEQFVKEHPETFVEICLRQGELAKVLAGKIPNEDEYWQHITWSLESQFNPQAALKKFNENPDSVQKTDQFNAYIMMNDMDDIGPRTDEVWAGGGASSGVYKKTANGEAKYTAMVWNPSENPLSVTFYNKDGALGSAAIAPHSLVRLDPTVKNQTQVSKPEISIKTGEYEDTQYVHITCDDKDAKIYYTVDGTTPTTNSNSYTGEKIPVSSSQTITAIAVKEGAIDSPIATSTITIKAEPEIGEANLALNQKVTVSSISGEEHAGKYAVDGDRKKGWESQMGKDDPEWIYVDLGKQQYISTIKTFWETARATAFDVQVAVENPDDDNSWTTVYTTENSGLQDVITIEAAKARYVKLVGRQKVQPGYGYHLYELEVYGAKHVQTPWITTNLEGENKVYTITSGKEEDITKGVEIRYTTDGSEPTEKSELYTPGMVLPKNTVITARAFKKGMIPSLSYTENDANWTSGRELDEPIAAPEFSVKEGTYEDTQYVALSCEMRGAEIYYSKDGSEPIIPYTGIPIVVSKNMTIRAMAKRDGYIDSNVVAKDYIINAEIEIGADNLAKDKVVSASCEDANPNEMKLSYIVDGKEDTRWQAGTKNGDEWVSVDLGKSYQVSQVKILWEASYATEYKIMYSLDNETWKQAGANVTFRKENDTNWNTITFSPVQARYMKLQCISLSGDAKAYGCSLYELQVFGAKHVETPKISSEKQDDKKVYTITTKTKGAEIHYVVAPATEVTKESPLYIPGMELPQDAVITARAFKDGMVDSLPYTEGTKWISGQEMDSPIPAPEFSVGSGTYANAQYVSMYSDMKEDVSIYYTLDGSMPVENEQLKYKGNPVVISKDTVLKAIAVRPGYITSDVTTAEYKITTEETSNTENLALKKPVTVSSGNGAEAVDGNQGTRWSADGDDDFASIAVDLQKNYYIDQVTVRWERAYPSEYQIFISETGKDNDWKKAAEDIIVEDTQKDQIITTQIQSIEARYVKIQCQGRNHVWGYSIYELEVYGKSKTATPQITKIGNAYQAFCDTPGAEIRYTTDGTEPTEESYLYINSISISETSKIVKFKAFKTGMLASDTVTMNHTDNGNSSGGGAAAGGSAGGSIGVGNDNTPNWYFSDDQKDSEVWDAANDLSDSYVKALLTQLSSMESSFKPALVQGLREQGLKNIRSVITKWAAGENIPLPQGLGYQTRDGESPCKDIRFIYTVGDKTKYEVTEVGVLALYPTAIQKACGGTDVDTIREKMTKENAYVNGGEVKKMYEEVESIQSTATVKEDVLYFLLKATGLDEDASGLSMPSRAYVTMKVNGKEITMYSDVVYGKIEENENK